MTNTAGNLSNNYSPCEVCNKNGGILYKADWHKFSHAYSSGLSMVKAYNTGSSDMTICDSCLRSWRSSRQKRLLFITVPLTIASLCSFFIAWPIGFIGLMILLFFLMGHAAISSEENDRTASNLIVHRINKGMRQK